MPKRVRHRSQAELVRDRKLIAAMYLEGALQTEIGAQLGIDQSTVSRDLATIRKAWIKSTLVDFNLARGRELAKIDYLELTYWEAWRLSLEEFKSRTMSVKPGQSGKPMPAGETIRTEEGRGDMRALAGVQWCIDRRIKLLGIDEAIKMDVMSGGKPLFDLVEWQRVRAERRRQVAEMGNTVSVETPDGDQAISHDGGTGYRDVDGQFCYNHNGTPDK